MNTQDNGIHEYYEDDEILVLRNHGEKYWSGMMKEAGGHKVLTYGPRIKTVEEAVERTRELREREIASRRGRSSKRS